MADNAVRFVERLAVGDRFSVAAVIVVSSFLEFLDSRRFDFTGLKHERHWRIIQRALEISQPLGCRERNGHRIGGYGCQKARTTLTKANRQHWPLSHSFQKDSHLVRPSILIAPIALVLVVCTGSCR